MLSGPIAELESRVERTQTFFAAKDTKSRSSRVRQGRVGTESEGLVTQDVEENTELRHLAFF